MGQATADLPKSTAKTDPPKADDLLSQLAGEEIDRLLAEADVAPNSDVAHDPAYDHPIVDPPQLMDLDPSGLDPTTSSEAESPAAEAAAATTAEALDEIPDMPTPADVDQEIASAAAATQPTSEAFEQQVDELFKELSNLPGDKPVDPPPPAPAAAAVQEAPSPASPEPALTPAAAEIAAEIEKEASQAVERAALQSAPAASAPATQPSAAEAKPSILVRVLELVNAPVQSLPDSIRDALGKVAILTTMNAIGVFLYLLLFKR